MKHRTFSCAEHRMRLVAFSLMVMVLVSAVCSTMNGADSQQKFDVVVYGATPSGIAAAVALARRDDSIHVALVTPYRRVGGMITNGLTHPDFRTFEARTGLFREFNQRVENYFVEKYGAESQEVKDSLLGTHAGPEVNHIVLRGMIDELSGIRVFVGHELVKSEVLDGRITSIQCRTSSSDVKLAARYFVDATYEGDLMAAAGVPFRIGREASSEYNESLAPHQADDQLQGYNFRLTMTDVPANQIPVPKPKSYRREDYLDLLPLLTDAKLKCVFGDPYGGISGGIYKRQTPALPEGKRDINDISQGLVRLSMPGHNQAWPEGDKATRERIFDEHVRHNIGMLYFLQNDKDVSAEFQKDALGWQLCRDELVDNGHLPEQLYVREARRMAGRYVFTQRDTERTVNSNHARAIFHPDAIAMGDYGPNCHGTHHEGPLYGGRHTGEFYQRAAPYQIPYGTILPVELENLAVPVACSSSHVGFCALRLEPIWMSLGQAAGEAIGLALNSDTELSRIQPAAIRKRLHESKCATIYTSDVPEESPDFAAVQWWGSQGGLVALDRATDGKPRPYGQRGKQRIGQYCFAFPGHAVELDQPLDAELTTEWLKLAETMDLQTENLKQAKTRGDFIRSAWASHRAR